MAPNENFLSFSNCTITFYNQICWAMLAFLCCGKSQDNPIMNQTHAPSSTSSTQGFNKVVIVTSLAFVVAQLDVSIVNIALPDIASTFGADIHVLQWIIDAYTLAFAALLLSAGNLADLLGAKAVFQSGMLIFGLASIACGFSPTGEVLTSFRALQGLGAAVMIPSSLAILNQSFAHVPTMRVKAVALWTAAGSAAIAAGPIVGGIIIHLSNWRYIFFVNAPICAIGIFLTSSLKLEKTPARSVKFDVWGQLCWMLSITVLISAVIELPKRGLESPYIYGALILSAISFYVFLLIERKVPSPMLPLGLFRSASFNSLLVLGAVLNGFYYGSVFLISLYLQNVLHYSSIHAGLAFLPLTAGFVISNLLSGNIINRYGIRRPILIGLMIFALGFALLFIAGSNTPYWQLFSPFLLISLGMGLAVPSMTTGILSSTSKALTGTASATLNTGRQAAGAMGVAALGAIAAGGNSEVLHALKVCVVIAVLAAILTILLILKYVKVR
jgi:DHA2 family methylenomycin A resistance protein-like MFS transporter